MNTNTMPLEAETRVLIDSSLENLGWKLSGKDQNVYYEQPRTDAEKRSSVGSGLTMSFIPRKVTSLLL